MRLYCMIFLLVALPVLVVGCGTKPPDGFPKVFPCTIKVVDGGTPIEGCSVTLSGPSGVAYACGGATDASGVATLGTTQGNFHQPGAPAGEYKVVLSKAAPTSATLTEEQARAMEPHERQAFMQKVAEEQAKAKSVVPPNLSDPTKTTIKLTVAEGGNNTLEIDLVSHQ